MCFSTVWKNRYKEILSLYAECQEKKLSLSEYITHLEVFIADQQLEPPPEIEFVIKDAGVVYSQLIEVIFRVKDSAMIVLPCVDSEYKILNDESFRKIAKWTWTDKKEYIETFYDCDDFYIDFIALVSRYFDVNSVAQVVDYSSGHAYNIVILQSGVYIFEPQTDGLYDIVNRNRTFYGLEEGYIQV